MGLGRGFGGGSTYKRMAGMVPLPFVPPGGKNDGGGRMGLIGRVARLVSVVGECKLSRMCIAFLSLVMRPMDVLFQN